VLYDRHSSPCKLHTVYIMYAVSYREGCVRVYTTHTQVLARANALPLSSSDGPSRFKGFSQHYEDYSPAADHLSMMRIAMHEMLMGKLDDDHHTITLFPGACDCKRCSQPQSNTWRIICIHTVT
jgi:hypothetical protein